MKRKILLLAIFAAATALVIACSQIALNSGDKEGANFDGFSITWGDNGDDDDENGGDGSRGMTNVVCTHAFPSGGSSWSQWEYIGVVGDAHSHRMRCYICDMQFTGVCTTSFDCTDCGRKVVVSDIDTNAAKITINEEIEKLVIVANKSFDNSEALKKYIQYKKDRKFNVVVKYFQTNSDAKDIRADLKKEYEANPSMAVLIVGQGVGIRDCSIPEFVNKNHPTLGGSARTVATDFYYGYYENDGKTNLFPQVAVGRLSARNEADLKAQVEKIMAMESGNVQNKNVVLVQHKTADGKIYFADEPRDIKKHFSGFGEKYSVREAFTNNPGGISSAINEGALLVSYSGHGQESSWGDSKFGIPNVQELKNSVYPIVLGVTCNSANFTSGDGCMAEAFMRNGHGGAVAYIGASAVMIADYSKAATVGTDEVPGMIKSLISTNSGYKVKTLGGLFLSALRRIKMSRTFYGDQEYKDYSIEVLNLFGDPTMSLEYITK